MRYGVSPRLAVLPPFEDDKLVFDDILGSGMKLTFAKEGER